jgi:N6-L-threonylcarbamoyladenine synthase
MRVLGIETSCDDTGVGIVDADRVILGQALYTQREEHEKFKGVVPEIAARAHLARLHEVCQTALKDANLTLNDIDAFAATSGPGLIGGVMVGLMTAKTFAAVTGKPFIAVNHLEAHVLTPRLSFAALEFPFMVLLVSGGHTQIILAAGYRDYRLIGSTRDDAAGEAFDKCAKLLGLGYPGGPALEALAAHATTHEPLFGIPMQGDKSCDFSFSGLKTAMRNALQKHGDGPVPQDMAAQLAWSLQHAVTKTLADRCNRALSVAGMKLNGLVAVGGVAANKSIRAALEGVAASHDLPFYAPPLPLCTDNGVMIAWAGMEALQRGITNKLTVPAKPRWPLHELTLAEPYPAATR